MGLGNPFQLHEVQHELRQAAQTVGFSLRLVCQSEAQEVQREHAMAGRKCLDVAIPLQHRAADSVEQKHGRTCGANFPVTSLDGADFDEVICEHVGDRLGGDR